MEAIVKEYDFYNCLVRVVEDDHRDRSGEIDGKCYGYQIIYPGDIVIYGNSWWYSINDCLEGAIYDICDGDVSMIREFKLRIVFDEV